MAPLADVAGPVADAPPGDSTVDAAWAAVLTEFAAVDAAMSRFRADSEITLLNGSGTSEALSRRLRVALFTTERARRLTAGRFDPRVLRQLDRLGFEGARIPDAPDGGDPDRRAASARGRVIDCDAGHVRLSAPVDLGGIGKGLALRWAADAAERILGGRGFLLDAGGDVVTRGPAPAPEGGSPGPACWSIAIEDPLDGHAGEPVATCALRRGFAIATSSTRIGRREGPDGIVHHLLDPDTGRPGGSGLLAVSVAWPDPAWAEVWSKSLFLAGADAVAGEARRRGLAAWWIGEAGDLSMTPAARAMTTWVRDEVRRDG